MRAVSYDHITAGLMGVNGNAVISFTFGIGAALAGWEACSTGSPTPDHTFMG